MWFPFQPFLEGGVIMARKQSSTQTPATETVSKAEAVRRYHAEHPDEGPRAISEGLKKQGIDVTPGRVSGVLRQGSGGRVDVETIKAAGAFVAGFDGSIDEAVASISTVGEFVEKCGGAQKAKTALEAFKGVGLAVNGK
jgi:hypothetical protein